MQIKEKTTFYAFILAFEVKFTERNYWQTSKKQLLRQIFKDPPYFKGPEWLVTIKEATCKDNFFCAIVLFLCLFVCICTVISKQAVLKVMQLVNLRHVIWQP